MAVPCEQIRVVAEALGPQPRTGTDVEQVIEILADGLPGGKDVATEVPLREHAVEMGLCGSQLAMNEFTDVPASPGFWIAGDVNADRQVLGPLRMIWLILRIIFCLLRLKCGTRVAHVAAA